MWSISFIGLPGTFPQPAITLADTAANRPPASSENEGWLYLATDTNGGTLYRSNGVTWVQCAPGVSEAGGGSPHALLDGSTHSDTVAQSVTRGSLIYGNSTPAWDELTIGAGNTFVRSNGTDVAWSTIDHGTNVTGLSDDDHSIYALLAGRAGGQTLSGGSQNSQNLTLNSTSGGTKGLVRIAQDGGHVTVGGGATASELRLLEASGGGSSYAGFVSPSLAGNTIYTLPTAFPGANDYMLLSSTAGVLSWAVQPTATSAASQAEQEAGSEAAKYVAPATQHFHPSAAKAWVAFDGVTAGAPTRSDYNCDAMSDHATGNFSVNFTTDFSGTDNLAVAGFSRRQNDTAGAQSVVTARDSDTWGADIFEIRVVSGSADNDTDQVCLIAFGDQA